MRARGSSADAWRTLALLKESQNWDKTAMLKGKSTSGSKVDPKLLVNLGALDFGDSWNNSTREKAAIA